MTDVAGQATDVLIHHHHQCHLYHYHLVLVLKDLSRTILVDFQSYDCL